MGGGRAKGRRPVFKNPKKAGKILQKTPLHIRQVGWTPGGVKKGKGAAREKTVSEKKANPKEKKNAWVKINNFGIPTILGITTKGEASKDVDKQGTQRKAILGNRWGGGKTEFRENH